MDESELVALAQAGDAVAFGSLLRESDAKMRGLAYRLVGDQTTMDDVLQDAYFKAFRSIRQFQPERSGARFSTWLYRIVHSACMDHHRRTARRPQVALVTADSQPLELADLVRGIDPAVTVTHRVSMRDALAQLPPEQAAVVVLADGEGYSYDEIADTLGINPGTVASRLSRARAALRDHLNEAEPRQRGNGVHQYESPRP